MTGVDGTGVPVPTVPRRPRRSVLVGWLLVAVLVATAGVMWGADRRAAERDGVRGAVAAAEHAATAMLRYEAQTVAEDLAAVEPLLTDPFLTDFRDRSRQVTVPRATAGQVRSSARSAGAAAVVGDGRGDDDHGGVGVVVYLDRHTTGRDGISRVLQTVVELTMVDHDGTWLVAQVIPR